MAIQERGSVVSSQTQSLVVVPDVASRRDTHSTGYIPIDVQNSIQGAIGYLQK